MPFTPQEFLQVFSDYNGAVWPIQNVWVALALALIAAAFLPSRIRPAIIPIGLALLWTWMGTVYHLIFFRRINPAATAFGIAFLLEAVLLGSWAFQTRGLSFRPHHTPRALAGAGLLAFALLIYPKLTVALGHVYPAQPTFGLPCPTTIATLGLLLWATPSPPWWVWAIPILWAGVGSAAALRLGMREDWGLPIAGLLVLTLNWMDSRERRSATA
ncbi:MAG TPA: DUF6064 family protein [Gemmatimonadales bacterium]|nr:DUF6064 family protein [Gemmatimonadales bacterium]